MKHRYFWLAMCLALILTGAVRADDDLIENPEYLAWSKFGVSTSVTYSTDSNMMGNAFSMVTKITLADVTANKATLRTDTSLLIDGKSTQLPPQTRDIPAKVKKPADYAGVQPADAPKTQVSSEDVWALGRKFACRKTKVTTSADAMTNWTSTWTSAEVPGGVVKTDSETSGAETGTVKMILTAIDLK